MRPCPESGKHPRHILSALSGARPRPQPSKCGLESPGILRTFRGNVIPSNICVCDVNSALEVQLEASWTFFKGLNLFATWKESTLWWELICSGKVLTKRVTQHTPRCTQNWLPISICGCEYCTGMSHLSRIIFQSVKSKLIWYEPLERNI